MGDHAEGALPGFVERLERFDIHGQKHATADYGAVVTAARWESDEFREELAEFVRDEVGLPTSLTPVHIRPWSSVWRVETEAGVVFAKENCPEQDHEADLLLTLDDLAPGRVMPVIASQGAVFLMPDLGAPLGDSIAGDIDVWCRIAVAHAELQRLVAPQVERLGLVSLPPQSAAGQAESVLARLCAFEEGDPRRPSDDDAQHVRDILPRVARWSEQVAALQLPITLAHNDLHAHNVFEVDGEIWLFDLGDAVAMEPLAGLLIPLNVLSNGLGAASGRSPAVAGRRCCARGLE